MLVKDIMTKAVITITSDTYVLDAERIMEQNRINRLPIVDDEKLVGIVTKNDVLKASPESTTPFNQRQLFYLMSKLTVKEIMKTDVLTISPDTPIEKSVAVAQQKRVGSLPVVEGDRVVGILTTNDVFYKILNPLLGVGEKGKRIIIHGAGKNEEMQRITEFVRKKGLIVKTYWIPPDLTKRDLIVHLDIDDATGVITELRNEGYEVELRDFAA
ncbi:MAG: Hypoxic response protein 1 [Syntrophorhabdus sp. PtaU1.Bin002]|nr:MAG: Hypoxic response protein 1 [Syntrophorhabdus sp. PtaB.Bin006]OPY71967.1 MAG: Hypoxic response protein 1 [Syntrophorhabdus sp. PtaU1.Bin002]